MFPKDSLAIDFKTLKFAKMSSVGTVGKLETPESTQKGGCGGILKIL